MTEPKIRRRDFLKWPVAIAAGYALTKSGLALTARPAKRTASNPPPLQHLSERQAAIVVAAAMAFVGPAAEQSYQKGEWDPAAFVDGVLGRLAPDQRAALGFAITFFEHGRLGLRGFSHLKRDEQLAYLAAWRTNDLAIKRSVWGFLHAASCAAYSGSEAGWRAMGYSGPCVASGPYGGRPPGQTAIFVWDEKVP